MKKITTTLLKQSFKEIGIKGTFIRGLDFFSHKFAENEQLYKYVSKHYKKTMSEGEITCPQVKNFTNQNIWVCWFQGMENAPLIVQKCFESLKEKNPDNNIIVITDDNYSEYVVLPQNIIKKYKEGIITRTHFSDILRANLLFNNGGLWVDSTMFFTDTIPKYVWNSKMFAFSIYNPDTKQVASSQFLYAESGNEVLGRTLCGLYKYWENNDKLITYYLFHYFFAVAVDCRSTCKELWDSTPKYFSEVNHVLQRELFNDYSDEKWRYFEKVSFVHKLSYKHIDKEKINKRTTFYNKIIGNLYYE